jgi:hypothetical protein
LTCIPPGFLNSARCKEEKFLGVTLIRVVPVFGRAMANQPQTKKLSHAVTPADELWQHPATWRCEH